MTKTTPIAFCARIGKVRSPDSLNVGELKCFALGEWARYLIANKVRWESQASFVLPCPWVIAP